jgi:glycosyltransferase involved in cell wall biosynthesis
VNSPKLTIVIPTFNRPELLPRALASALDQTLPARIIVADDGDCDKTSDILAEQFAAPVDSGQVTHLRTGASYAWDNFRAGMEAADTLYVSWLQDDDVVCPVYSERIASAFDQAPSANVWFARLCAAPDGRMALWYASVGPWVPMDLRNGVPYTLSQGSILASSAYMTSWALPPATAYRNGPLFRQALRKMPPYCDIFMERLMPALAVGEGSFIADPIIAGYWIQHDHNLSRKQHSEQAEHTKRFLPVLDDLLSTYPTWQDDFAAWCQLIPANMIAQWLGHVDQTCKEGGGSRHQNDIKRLMVLSLEHRIRFGGERRWWKRAANWIKSRAAL